MTVHDPVVDRRPLTVRWAWLLVLVGGVAAYLIVLRTLVATQNPLYVPSLLLLGSAVVPASVLVYAASGPGRPPVGAGLIAAVAGAGGVIGTVAAGTLEYDTLQRLRPGGRSVRRRVRGERRVARALGRLRAVARPRGRGPHQRRGSAGRDPSFPRGRPADLRSAEA